jgi:hypothetical protein
MLSRLDAASARTTLRRGADLKTATAPPSAEPRYWQRLNKPAAVGREQWSWAVVLLTIAAVCYNAGLAFINAHGMSVGRAHVILAEVSILSAGGLVILASGPRLGDGAPSAFVAFFILDALIVSLMNNMIFVDMARNTAIIGIFMLLGARIDSRSLDRCFTIAAILVAGVLLIEMVSSSTYATLFQPASYFAQTRGIAKQAFDQLGLFGNALGYDSRFAIVTLMDHRACSLFLEQVSLANFGIILAMYLACKWEELPPLTKFTFAVLVVLIVLTTNSRLALALVLLTPVAALLAPLLQRNLTLLVMPVTMLIAGIVAMNSSGIYADDLQGRLTKAITELQALDVPSLLGMRAFRTPLFADSGYTYVVCASSMLGIVALWLFVSLIAAENRPRLLRCSLLLTIYVFCSLTVSGDSVFSSKTAALLWLLVGNLRANALAGRDSPVQRQRTDRFPKMRSATAGRLSPQS